MKERLYDFLTRRNPHARRRYESLRQRGLPRWRAAPTLLGGFCLGRKTEKLPLPVEKGESAWRLRESPQRLAEQLAQFQVVTFDVFDTLLLRGVDDPTEVFSLVGAKLRYPDFRRLRQEAERLARRKKEGCGEVTLEEIWQELSKLSGVPWEEGMKAELEVEQAVCAPNPYFLPVIKSLRDQGVSLALVSDMYLPRKTVEALVESAGFGTFEACFVSGEEGASKWEGGLFDRVKKQFPGKTKFAHVGDNPHSDGKMAEEKGFVPFLYENVNRIGGLFRAEELSSILGSVYRGLVNGKLHNGSQRYSKLYEYGFVYGGLFAVGYCRFIKHWADAHQAEKLLFLSRDGEVLLDLYRRMYPEDSRPVYAYWSRLAAAKITAGLFPADYFRRFLWHKAHEGISLEQVFRSMELEPLLPQMCQALSISGKDRLTYKTAGAIQDYLTEVWDQVLELYAPQRKAAGAYYGSLLSGCKKVAAIDIGWAGSGAISLARAAQTLWGMDLTLTGLIAGTNSAHSPERDSPQPLLLTGALESYLFSQGENRDLWTLHDPRQGHNLFWELLLGGEEGSLKGFYPDKEKGWKIQLGENPHKLQVREIHRGILEFGEEFTNLERRLGMCLPISGRDAYAPMLEVFRKENAPYRRGLEALLDEPGIG